MNRPYVVGITGASGSLLGVKLIEQLLLNDKNVILSITEAGKKVIKSELDINLKQTPELKIKKHIKNNSTIKNDIIETNLKYLSVDKIDGSIASGSFKTKGMIILPCSMATLSSIAHGSSSNLIERAADVVLKENLPLILSPREMPFNSIHLENMLKLSKMNVIIAPPVLTFYHKPKNIEDVIDYILGKILDRLNIENDLFSRWEGEKKDE